MSNRHRSIKEKLKAAFSLSGLTYEEVGTALGCSKASAFRKLNDDQPISTEELEQLATLFDVKVDVWAGEVRG